MNEDAFKAIYLVFIVIYYILYTIRRAQTRRERVADNRLDVSEAVTMTLAVAGDTFIPLIYIFTPWLDFANYGLPPWISLLGAPVFAASLWLFYRAHVDLGRNWSPTLQLKTDHTLVTSGVYSRIRHPIYAAHWLWGLAQLLLLANWFAGLANLVLFLPVYLTRVPREEQMMLDHFGEAYRQYMLRTGRVIPKLR